MSIIPVEGTILVLPKQIVEQSIAPIMRFVHSCIMRVSKSNTIVVMDGGRTSTYREYDLALIKSDNCQSA